MGSFVGLMLVPALVGVPASAEPVALTHARALAVVAQHGYQSSNSAAGDHWRSRGLNVIVAIRTGSADGYTQHAFFFYGRRYLGTDAKEPSASISAARTGPDTITLTYRLYRPSDAMVDPTGGNAGVRFRWNGTRLVTVDHLPPSSPEAARSRL